MKSLSQIDSIYSIIFSKLAKQEKIEYCEVLIARTKNTLERNKTLITKGLQNQLYDIIVAAQAELTVLLKEKNN